MTTFLIGLAAFSSVFLGCFQTINVTHGRHVLAVLTSMAQSGAALTLYRFAPQATTSLDVAVFMFGAISGGQLSMYVTRRQVHK